MIETLKYATISQIYVKDLKFFDDKNIDELRAFCKQNGFTFLPSRNRNSVYKLIDNNFTEIPLSKDLICNPYDRLFDRDTLSKFEINNHDEVLFVTEKNKIKGVVHIVDYNNEMIFFEFYKLIYRFEKNLRKFLIQKNENNDSIIDWFKYQSENGIIESQKLYWNKRYLDCLPENNDEREKMANKRNNCDQLQTFYLNDLLYFTLEKKYLNSVSTKKIIIKITNVRNWISHNNDLISRTNNKLESPIYNIDNLKTFISSTNTFFDVYEELEEAITL